MSRPDDPRAGLVVTGLGVVYGGVRAVDGVGLDVQPGRCTVVVGANGAGKTSVLRAIGGLVRVGRSTSVRLGEKALERLDAASRARLGLGHCLEGRHVFPGLTVRENLELGRIASSDRAPVTFEDVVQVFPELVQLQDTGAGKLSGGQQQFLAIARALMGSPRVLMLDEPTNGLAPLLVQRVVETIRRLKADGMGVLLVEQRLEVAQAVGDEIHLMSHGQLLHRTTADDEALAGIARSVYLGAGVPPS